MPMMTSGRRVRVTHRWVPRPGPYHQHEEEYSSGGRLPFLVHRHDGGDVDHGHQGIWVAPGGAGYHATDVVDFTPADDIEVALPDWSAVMVDVRRRQAEMDAVL